MTETETNETRKEWIGKTTWSESVFSSLERFVGNNSESSIRTFVRTENQDDLYDGMGPEPRPSGEHVEYMIEYAENEILNK